MPAERKFCGQSLGYRSPSAFAISAMRFQVFLGVSGPATSSGLLTGVPENSLASMPAFPKVARGARSTTLNDLVVFRRR